MIKLAYKRLETDAEFRARLSAAHPYWREWLDGMSGETLEYQVYAHCNGAQRRIVEIFP